MRPFQLSAVLVSAGMLLSGCYLGRPSVDRSQIRSAATVDEVCHVSGVPVAAEAVLAVASVPMTYLVYLFQALSQRSGDSGALFVVPLALGAFFAADALAGDSAEEECSDARTEWRIMKMREQRQAPASPAPQPAEGPAEGPAQP